ncbi:MAG: hypothetical protein U0835_13430 [Isosphaeraceae bacterium]
MIRTRYELRNDSPALVRLPEVDFIDDKAGKPVAIGKFIGKRPIAAFGNSDGDYEMLRYVTSALKARLGLIVFTPMPTANTTTTAIRLSAASSAGRGSQRG